MIKHLFIFLLLPLTLIAKQEYINLSHKISDPFVKEYSKKNDLYPFGLGGGMMHDVDHINIVFSGNQRLNIAEVRRLFVNGMEDFLQRYNTNLTIRPYLHNFPFTNTNLNLSFLFLESAGGFVPDNYVASVSCIYGTLYYRYNDRITDNLMSLHEEPYETALQIVKSERRKQPGVETAHTGSPQR